jgi:hypothetical protein
MSSVAITDRIDELEDEIAKLPQVKLEVDEWFADGLYARAMFIPAGVALTGAKHKRGMVSILMKGELTLVGDGENTHVKAPKVMVSEPGTRRAGFAHSDTIIITICATECKDSSKIMEATTEPARPHIEKVRVETGQGEINNGLLPNYGGA